MENRTVTGIGCFARPQKLSRIFLRMVRTYSLGQIGAADLVEGCTCRESVSTDLIRALIEGHTAGLDGATRGTAALTGNRKITGFYLALKGNSLELSIFARNRTRQQEIHSAVLHKLTRFRQKRLN